MKKFLTAVIIACGVISCTTYDDTELRGEINNLKAQVDALDVQLQKTNANLNALQIIVDALDGNEYITAIEDVLDSDGNVVGYTITFAQAGRKTIYNGKDGHSPAIQAVMNSELGVYCWQLDGEWLLAEGKPVPVAGATPQLKLDNGTWKISYDGNTWTPVPVTGEDVTVVCQFESVEVSEENNSVTFVTASGETFTLPLGARFAIQFPAESVNVQEGETVDVAYTIVGADEDTEVYLLAYGAWTVKLQQTDYRSGVLKVSAPESADNETILLGAANHKGQSDLKALYLTSKTLKIGDVDPQLVSSEGGNVTVQVTTNIDYTIKVSEEWLTYIDTKSLRTETLTFSAASNPTKQIRTAQVQLLDAEGNAVQTFTVAQDKNVGEFSLNWAYSDASVTPSFGYTEPAIDADGNVYVISGNALVKISNSGAQAWTKALSMWGGTCSDVTPSLEADGSVVYTAGGTDNVVGVYALNAADGSEKWTIGHDAFFCTDASKKLSFWRAGVAVGDDHLFVSCTRNYSINAFSKTDGSRTTYASTKQDGSRMEYSLTCSPVLTTDGVVAAKSGAGMVGANQSLMENPSEDFKTTAQDYYVPCGIYTTFKQWAFNDRCPVIAVNYEGNNYVVTGGTESKNHHFHVWYQKSVRGLETTVPSLPSGNTNIDYYYTLSGMKQTAGTGGGGLVAGARNEVIVSAEPADLTAVDPAQHPYVDGGFVAVWPAKKSATDAYAYKFAHTKTIPGSCAVDNNGYVHAVDIEGTYFILAPDYENKTVTQVKKTTLKELVKGCGVAGLTDAESVTVKSSVKIGQDGKLYVNANFKKGATTVGGTVCFSFEATTGVCAESSWPQAGADAMNTNRQIGY